MEADVEGPLLPRGAPSHPEHTGRPVASVPARCPHWVAQGAGGGVANSHLPSICDQAALRGGPSFQASF